MKRPVFIILLVLAVFGTTAQVFRSPAFKGAAAKRTSGGGGGGGGGASLPYSQDFEGTGRPTDWVDDTGTPDYDYTGDPLAGSQSLYCGTGGDTIALLNITASANVYMYFQIKIPDATTSTFRTIVGGGSFGLLHGTGSDWYLTHGSVDNYPEGTTSTPGNGVLYYIWLEYQKGTGSDGNLKFYKSTNTTKPGSPDMEITTGDATSDCSEVNFRNWESDKGVIFDTLKIRSTSPFGDNGS